MFANRFAANNRIANRFAANMFAAVLTTKTSEVSPLQSKTLQETFQPACQILLASLFWKSEFLIWEFLLYHAIYFGF